MPYDSGVGGNSKSVETFPPSEFGHGTVELQERVGLINPTRINHYGPYGPYHGPYHGPNHGKHHAPVLPDSKRRPFPNSSEPAQGHENFQHPWSSRRHSYMKMFKHEDFQNDDQSKKATLLPEDPPPRRSSNIPSPLFCPSLELSSYDISYVT